MKRAITTISLLSALLLAAGVAYAQEDITLAHVWKTVQGMQADFTIFALELRRANDRLHVVESTLDEFTADPILIDGERCLLTINNNPHTDTLSSYINTYGSEPPHMEFLTVQSIYFDTKTNEIVIHFRDGWSSPNRHAYEFWHKCEFSRSSEWQDQPHHPPAPNPRSNP